MKHTHTKLFVAFAAVIFFAGAYALAQNAMPDPNNTLIIEDMSTEESIVLPEVTTTVSGDSLTAGKDALPDFSQIIPSHEDGVGLLPQLPGVTQVELPDEPEAVLDSAPEREVYAQGLLGAGFPGYFIGDFSIYKSGGEDPFLLQFTHTQTNGYGFDEKAARFGFSDMNTALLGEKTFTFGAFSFTSSASYNTYNYGLQGKSACFSSMNHQNIFLGEKIGVLLPAGFSMSLNVPALWYHRYAVKFDSAETAVSFTSLEFDSTAFKFDPKYSLDWKYNAFSAGLSAQYDYDSDGTQNDRSFHASLHRGEFGASFGWQDYGFRAGADASFVIGTHIGNNSYLVPFSADFGGEWKIGASLRPLTLDLKGGLRSSLSNKSELEKNSLFALHTLLDSEVSDWFASFKMSIPVLASFTIDTSADFALSAFGNGDWCVDYTNANATGLYSFAQTERLLIGSKLSFSYTWKWCTFALGWNAWWGEFVPACESPYALTFTFNIQDEEGIWGADLSVQEALGNGVDYVPVVNLEGYYRFLNNFRLALQVQDAVKLVMDSERSYASSAYLAHAGGVNVLVRFFF